ncbi:tripartite tricarboxylate transporter substrate binding protein [Bordetella sp. BOR01]|uniref:Bug family tripartite tricarboxylate transporter substrate binding protein n=1 Tax=Bordetella sp. BOR01 TaxID=2854779 RepID=UPI001C43DF09|nr:tripartite tricarboxylate transporter substrate binding protein [Bordetella sp. BOR01]MBV7481687.1 tripartite tricarboxylate transporter substrate binding protein [Bordetella sp. BOR01]
MQRRQALLAAAAIGILSSTARAQGTYPTRLIKLVVPAPAGGPTDVFARRYAERLREIVGQPVVVENRAGAGTTLGANAVAKALPDGYTLLFGTSSSHVTSPLMLRQCPYDPLKDFSMFIVGVVPLVLAVRPDLPAQNFQDFLKLVRGAPGKYTFGSAGPGSINHLAGELLKLRAGLDALHIPFRGTNPAQVALMSGQIDFLCDTFGTALPQHQAGKLRIIATLGEQRSASAPEIPTTIESGIPDSSAVTVNHVAMPARVPPAVLHRLTEATRKVMSDPELAESLSKMGIEPVADPDPVRSARFIAAEIARWTPIIKASGVSI